MDIIVATVAWLLTGLAAASMAVGNPTAVNGVLGAGVIAVVFTALAIFDPA